jgi:hypothetical protein
MKFSESHSVAVTVTRHYTAATTGVLSRSKCASHWVAIDSSRLEAIPVVSRVHVGWFLHLSLRQRMFFLPVYSVFIITWEWMHLSFFRDVEITYIYGPK